MNNLCPLTHYHKTYFLKDCGKAKSPTSGTWVCSVLLQ